MAVVNLSNTPNKVVTGDENLAIVQIITTKRGGASLDVTGFAPKEIKGGHLIIKETATGELKPMPVNAENTAYEALPFGHEYYGYNIATIPTDKAFASPLLRGTVNPSACPYPMDDILDYVKVALPHILHQAD